MHCLAWAPLAILMGLKVSFRQHVSYRCQILFCLFEEGILGFVSDLADTVSIAVDVIYPPVLSQGHVTLGAGLSRALQGFLHLLSKVRCSGANIRRQQCLVLT